MLREDLPETASKAAAQLLFPSVRVRQRSSASSPTAPIAHTHTSVVIDGVGAERASTPQAAPWCEVMQQRHDRRSCCCRAHKTPRRGLLCWAGRRL